MEETPRVSVLLPVRNGGTYLAEAIDSIVNQTFADWEMVIIDNASTDGSAVYAGLRARLDPRIRVFRNEEDIGVTRSLNRGVGLCRGELIARMDSDDRAAPQRLARQVAFMDANPDVAALSCFAHYINPAGERVGPAPHDLTTRRAFERAMKTTSVIGILHPGAMLRREALVAIGGYRPEYEPAEDIDLWNRLSERGPVLVLPEFLMDYRLHSLSIVATTLPLAQMKREWVEAGMRARRSGRPEPTWQEFLFDLRAAPPVNKWMRQRRLLADRLARTGRQDVAVGFKLRGALKLALATALRPAYATQRLLHHLASLRLPADGGAEAMTLRPAPSTELRTDAE